MSDGQATVDSAGCQHENTTPPSDTMLRRHPEVLAAMAVEPTGNKRVDRLALRRLVALAFAASAWTDPQICALAHSADSMPADGLTVEEVCALVGLFLKELRDARPNNDRSNAGLFALVAGGDVAWVSGGSDQEGNWRAWDGDRWRDGDSVAAEGAARRVTAILIRLAIEKRAAAEALAGDAATKKEAKLAAKRAYDWAVQSGNGARIAAMLRLARGEEGMAVAAEHWDRDTALLNCTDHTLTLRRSLDEPVSDRPHNPADRITKITRCAADDASGERWQRWLKETVPDPDIRAYLQRLAGYTLIDGNPERVIVFLVGPSSTGKSTFVEVLGRVLGDYAASFSLAIFRGKRDDAPRPDVIDALPRRMIYTSEAATDFALNADEIKRMVSADTIRARTLRKAMEGRAPAFTAWIATNKVPEVKGADDALRRRLAAVPFNHVVDRHREDVNLADDIVQLESGSVLAWALEGYADYCARGLAEVPAACTTLVDSIMAEMSSVEQWFGEHCELDREHDAPVDQLWGSYATWCDYHRVKTDTPIEFGRQLTRLGVGERRKAGGRDNRYYVRTGVHLHAMQFVPDTRRPGRTGGISVVR